MEDYLGNIFEQNPSGENKDKAQSGPPDPTLPPTLDSM
jgi:hypothetical protein|tara:strand:- start:54 stop:167 length:114 start_codon:yes stop_codon:yes gene_type:complete